MNPIVFGIMIALFVLGFLYLTIKNLTVRRFNKALKQNDDQQLIALINNKFARLFLNDYACDLYLARVYFNKKQGEDLLKQLRSMMKKTYEGKDEEQYLSLYYHYYVHLRNKEVALELLERIKQTQNAKLINYCTWTNEVIFDGENDKCASIEAAIENKDYYGFPLATCSYLIGLQKKQLQIYQDAIEWLETSLDVFMNNDIYVVDVKKEVDELHQLGYFSKDKQRKRK